MKVEREKVAKWGDFNPSDLAMLTEKGLDFRFYLIGKKEIAILLSTINLNTNKTIVS